MVKKLGQKVQLFNVSFDAADPSKQTKQTLVDIHKELCAFFSAVIKFLHNYVSGMSMILLFSSPNFMLSYCRIS